jgi:DNA-binding NtrC family response regulator
MCKVLVVEDERHLRRLYTEELEFEGHQVLAVSRGDEAVSLLQYMPIDVVVLDLVLPDGNAIDYLPAMLKDHHDLKIVINSAYPAFKQDFRSWGAEQFITKSSDLSELKRVIDDLANAPQLRQLYSEEEHAINA